MKPKALVDLMSSSYLLSNEAREDLREIWHIGFAEWGEKQADNYILEIDQKCELLAENPNIGKCQNEILKGLKSYPIGSHLIFYFVDLACIFVVRILRQGRDYKRHLN